MVDGGRVEGFSRDTTTVAGRTWYGRAEGLGVLVVGSSKAGDLEGLLPCHGVSTTRGPRSRGAEWVVLGF